MVDYASASAASHYKSGAAFKLPQNTREENPLLVFRLNDKSEQEGSEVFGVDILLVP